jgi:hypothetical protein
MASSLDWPSIRLDRLSLPRGSSPDPLEGIDSLESARAETLRGLA